jgi:UDP-3-O-acyl N-acetylglucosamine deacetylase
MSDDTTMQQRTLQSKAVVEGVGLFTGAASRCSIHPAPADSGLVFLLGDSRIPVRANSIRKEPVHPVFAQVPPRCSAVGEGAAIVWTVEHVLSALRGLGITNAMIEMSEREVPIMDGSALAFVESMIAAGIQSQNQNAESVVIKELVRVERGDSWIEATPSSNISYQYTIDYGPESPIVPTTVSWDGEQSSYQQLIAPARTFSLKHEADMMHQAGLFTHLTPSDLLVLGEDGPIENELRHEHECAQHKLLDLIGDVALLGKPVIGAIRGHKSGHSLAHELVRAIDQQ